MTGKVLELQQMLDDTRDGLAEQIANTWQNWNSQRQEWLSQKSELRNYIFATDTTTTTNSTLPWKNKTTLPKLCQIRDNLHSNYISALFPNERWLKWEGKSLQDEAKRDAIQQYMDNKVKESDFRTIMSQLLLDYIDYGNCFATVEYVKETTKDEESGATRDTYFGPRAVRIDPKDIVFNPVAVDFAHSPKIIRTVLNEGELLQMEQDQPENASLASAIARRREFRRGLGTYTREDCEKAVGFSMDGFGNLYDYFQSPYVEVLTFYGDYHDTQSGTFKRNMKVTIIDRMFVIEEKENPSWFAQAPIFHCGWRIRQDNLYAMGPLDNLVGMQYRIDHLENLKADVFDLIAFPPMKVKGDVEEFVWGPMEQIYINGDGDVEMMAPNTQALQADMQIQILEAKMEEFAGAPREAMGIRTPGEKTAFEVQQLQNAAGRIFQEKIMNFEVMLMEKVLNAMLEISRRNLDVADTIRVFDSDDKVATFMNVNKDDITAKGRLRPVGARHFAEQAQVVQSLMGIANTPVWQDIKPHVSTENLAKMLEHNLSLGGWDIFKPNVAVMEAQTTSALVNQSQAQIEEEAQVPLV
ncbi:portal (connector) protein [Vibrio phage JSF23]|jgi:hypothetical protein|uniref:Portal (Connector) protein n=3 Tax=Icepovirus bengalense TaxID=2846603 RepID=A0A076G576_9CAUD|nr:head-tail adaptor [Vibrio phage ICP2]ADX87772.1 hypothetical protein TU12-16_00090 [Vibrio phage ICP2_2006_A]AII27063.1 portal (connector) protein [Vibrio phage ICP2_2011_A]ASV43786.1 portal (connector) protein [Vibrio phage JSF23]QIG62483.1 hypothetical protein Saratov12_00034 [Vibrio phage Saratov-12]QNL29727.1 hypothetical protein Saratov15_00047 [Vibrio phage Saratov-15]WJJ54288.1 head-tail adaptor [Vibrio phage JPW]